MPAMPEEPLPPPPPPPPPAPRPVILINQPGDPAFLDATPVMPIAEPGVIAPAPFAQVYAAPPGNPNVPQSMTMSPPPLPQSYYPPAYPAAQQQQQQPAWPVDPVAYRSRGAAGYSRPGIISALAITGIIVAALSFITSLFSGCTAIAINTYARRTAGFARTTVTTTVPKTTAQGVPSTVGPDGLAAAEREIVARALRGKSNHRLNAKQELQLEGFLAQHGRQIIDDQSITNKTVAKLISKTGQEFATAGNVSPDFFIFQNNPLPGRLILKDDAAIFKPDDYSPNLTTHTTEPVDETTAPTPAPAPTGAFVSNGLDDEQAQALLARVQQLGNGRVSNAQLSTLNSLMQSPTCANWVTDSSTIPGITAQVKSAAVRSDGSVTITFSMGKMALDPQGNLFGPVPPAPTVAPTTSPSSGGGPAFVMGSISVDKPACTLAIVDAALSALLAIYLLVIAILALRPAGAPRKFFIIYALLKLACGAMGVIGFAWMSQSLAASNDPNGFATSMVRSFQGMSSAALTLTAIGSVYAFGILMMLALSATAKDYYKSGT
jgi:hypothetical protein